MKVAFVYHDSMKGAEGKYYEGLASLSAVLKIQSHETKLIHLAKPITDDEFRELYVAHYLDFEVAAFTATSNAFPYVQRFARIIKDLNHQAITICGGPHATLAPEQCLRFESLDAVCIGEGEYALAEVCAALSVGEDWRAVKGIWSKSGEEIIRNPPRPLIENLSVLPMPDRELFEYAGSVDQTLQRLTFMGSRGCPYNCSHCCNHALKRILQPNGGSHVRLKPVEQLLREIERDVSRHPSVKELHFLDDILTLNRRWFGDFAHQYPARIGLPYVCNSRFEMLNEEVVGQLCASGCKKVQLGLESGDEFIRKDVLRRHQSEDLIVSTSDLCHKHGLAIHVYVMVGLPFENPRRCLNTVKLAARVKPETLQVSTYFPYPLTDLQSTCQENGFLTGKNVESYFDTASVLNMPDFRPAEISFARQYLRTFVGYYETAARLAPLPARIQEGVLEWLWLHPGLSRALLPPVKLSTRVFGKMYRMLRYHGGDISA